MKRVMIVLILLLVLLVPTSLSLAAPGYDRIIGAGETVDEDITVYNDDLAVEEGGTVNGNVTVFDGRADVAGSINGDVSVFGGSVELSGSIDGDLVVFGGDLELTESAKLTGDCVVFGGSVDDESPSTSCASPGANVLGALPSIRPPVMPELREVPAVPTPPRVPEMPRVEVRGPSLSSRVGHFLLQVTEVIGRSLLLGVLALVVTAVFPRQLGRVSDTIRRKPAASGAVGFLTAIAAPSLIVLLLVVLAITCVGIILYPAVFLLGLAVLAAALMGWIALGDIFGRAVLSRLGLSDRSLAATAALGTAGLTLLLGALGLLPFVWGEALIWILLSFVGLGAAALTQFGTKPYPPGMAPSNSAKVESVLDTMPDKEDLQ